VQPAPGTGCTRARAAEVALVRQRAQQSLDQIANYLDERAKWERRFGKD
jgi:hypothetical protein